ALPAIQATLVEEIRPGIEAGAIYARFAQLADEHGLASFLPKRRKSFGVGHGIGSDGHESPMLVQGETTPLREGMGVTLEPMLFAPGRGGGGIEDMVLITAKGGERLTRSPHTPRLDAAREGVTEH